ncbi:O-methyltransferase, partial [Virgibacillus sp. W0430]|uniref:O-methyltransferase n=1 Tax=Virgibacillus sp. W0430 TaxID=3391580 RepID=UPI003F46E395
PWSNKLEEYASENHVPIMDKLSIDFLKQIIRVKKPKSILEIGTAIGYSALHMSEAAPQSEIITIERHERRYKEARQYIKEQNRQKQIEVIYGDALEVLNMAYIKDKAFDFILIDAAKGQYKRFFELIDPTVISEGIIVSDNVLFKGYVATNVELKNKRQNELVKKIKNYNTWLQSHPNYITSFLPVGDGMALSIKK